MREPFMIRFANDWASAELVKQYITNRRKYGHQLDSGDETAATEPATDSDVGEAGSEGGDDE